MATGGCGGDTKPVARALNKGKMAQEDRKGRLHCDYFLTSVIICLV